MHSEDRRNWTARAEMDCGFLVPWRTIVNKVKAFCFEHGVKVEVLKTGLVMKNIQFLFSGHTTEQKRRIIMEAINRYFDSIRTY